MKYRRTTLVTTLTIIASVASAFSQTGVIAKVGDTEIKADDIRPVLAGLSEPERQALAADPALLSRTVRTLILQQMLFKEAAAAGWEKNPEVAAQLERIRQGAIAESYLQSVAKVPEGFPTEADLKAAYDARKEELLVPKQFRVAQIFIAAPEGDKAADEKARTRIDAIAKSLRAPNADFAAIARESSEERESASRGGEVGWLTEATLQPAIRAKVTALPKGGTSDPVRLADGWYIVRVLDTKDAHTATLEEVRDRLAALLRNERLRLNREAYLARLQQQTPVVLDELALGQLIKK
ncbi:MAG: peptidyl-prolyl cis-trans isomerase [Terrimicrobiaceae bacterium]|nr:peptidyl-prolyl cis-trans isomerase [Terrimicrobiaceae bacterium]